MKNKLREARTLELIGGRLCLDFANTVSTRIVSLRRDYLTCYGDLLEWSLRAGILKDQQVNRFRREARHHPARANRVLHTAIQIRETIYRVFSSMAHQKEPSASDMAMLNSALSKALHQTQILPTGQGFEWGWKHADHALDDMLWPIVRSAADLLTSPEIIRIRQCARREGCDWLFMDTSKNQSRRWCSMTLCGSLDKARRYYYRNRSRRRANV
jgi:predicted RNA-binding Zn ribbon-like protein